MRNLNQQLVVQGDKMKNNLTPIAPVEWMIPPEKHLRLRSSFFKMYLKCPAQALFRYFKGKVILPKSYTTFGTCMHKSAEHQNNYKRRKGSDIRLSVVQDVFNEEFKIRRKYTQWSKDEDPDKIILEGIKRCVPTYHERAKGFKPLYVEQAIEIVIPEANVTVTGTLDLINQNQIIRDLKCRRRAGNWLDPIKSFQKVVYSFGYREKFGKLPKGFVLDTLVRKAIPEVQTSELEVVDEEEWLRFKMLVVKVSQSIRMGLFYPKEEGNMFCSPNACGYWNICHKGDWMKLPKDGKLYMENFEVPSETEEGEDDAI